MSLRLAVSFATLLALTFAPLGAPVRAQTATQAPAAVIILVDSQQILAESAAGKSLRAQIESYRKKFQADLSKREEDLRKQEAELKRQRTLLSPEAFEERRKAFEQQVTGVQREIQERNKSFETALTDARKQLLTALEPIFADIMKEYGANLMLDQNQVVLGATSLDITQEAIRRLDTKLPKMTVQLPTQ